MSFKRIDAATAASLLSKTCHILDIRDPLSFQTGHIPNAILIDNSNVQNFLTRADKLQPVLVYCYHGMSSQSAAAYFAEHGFSEVYSLDGGYEVWKLNFPTES